MSPQRLIEVKIGEAVEGYPKWLKRRRWFNRTVRNGEVKIGGMTFVPDSHFVEYDGRLDGLRLHFALYWQGDKILDFIFLWGTAEESRRTNEAVDEDDLERIWDEIEAERKEQGRWPPPYQVDGYLPWVFWSLKEG